MLSAEQNRAYWLEKWRSFHFDWISSNCCTHKGRIYICGNHDCLLKQCISSTIFEVLSEANVGWTTGKNNRSQMETCYAISSISQSSAGNHSYEVKFLVFQRESIHAWFYGILSACQWVTLRLSVLVCNTRHTVMMQGVHRGVRKTEGWLPDCSLLFCKKKIKITKLNT